MSPHEMRIGDSERDAAVAALGEHYVAGRLTKDEYDERSAVAWQARTNSDLAPLFYDLPALQRLVPLPSAQPAPTRTPARSGGAPRNGFRFPLLPLLLVLIGLAILTRGWPLLLIVAVLWWSGVFRWGRRSGYRRTR